MDFLLIKKLDRPVDLIEQSVKLNVYIFYFIIKIDFINSFQFFL
jgi:hypothetical protein